MRYNVLGQTPYLVYLPGTDERILDRDIQEAIIDDTWQEFCGKSFEAAQQQTSVLLCANKWQQMLFAFLIQPLSCD